MLFFFMRVAALHAQVLIDLLMFQMVEFQLANFRVQTTDPFINLGAIPG